MGAKSSRARKDSQSNQAYPTRPQSAPLYPSEPPPPYTPTAQPYPTHSMAYGMNNSPVHHGYHIQSVAPVIHAQFDSGARFDAISRPTIPPPPPGVYPNSAQMAIASGQKATIVMDKKRNNAILGSKGAGYTFW